MSPGSEQAIAPQALQRPVLRLGTADDIPRLVSALADAFIDDPVYRWMLPGTVRLKPRLRAMFTAEIQQYGLPQGTVWTTAGCDGAVVTLPPDAWEMPKTITLSQLLTWARAFGTRLVVAAKVQRAMEELHPPEPHFYVRIIGVRPELQGRGLGSALMQPTLQKADSVGLPTYIEASSHRSAALYERLGFAHIRAFDLPKGGPMVRLMRRPPL